MNKKIDLSEKERKIISTALEHDVKRFKVYEKNARNDDQRKVYSTAINKMSKIVNKLT